MDYAHGVAEGLNNVCKELCIIPVHGKHEKCELLLPPSGSYESSTTKFGLIQIHHLNDEEKDACPICCEDHVTRMSHCKCYINAKVTIMCYSVLKNDIGLHILL